MLTLTTASRPRRTRWYVEVSRDDKRETRNILAYGREQALAFYIGRGYTVHSISSSRTRRALPQPAQASSGGWSLDRRALQQAIDFLGIKMPVDVKQTGHQGGRRGAHSFRARRGKFMRNPALDTAAGGMYHHITVKSWLDPEQASKTLWHELTHAMQAERAVARLPQTATLRQQYMAWADCSDRGKGVAYLRKPIEVEAREHERFADEIPLAKGRR